MDDLLDFSSDTYFMGEALRQARKAESQDEVPIGAVIVRNGEIIARAWNQVEILKDATAHAEMLAITQAESVVGRLATGRLRSLCDEGAVPDVRRSNRPCQASARYLRLPGSENRRSRGHDQPAPNAALESSVRNHTRRTRD